MRLHNLFFGGGRCFFCHINFKMLLITDRQVHWCQYKGSWLTDAIEGNFVRQPNIFVWSMNSHLLALFIYLFFHFCEYWQAFSIATKNCMKNIQTHIRFTRISTYRSGSATLLSLALGMNYQISSRSLMHGTSKLKLKK